MRLHALAALLLLSLPRAQADEGMWLPLLLRQINQADMQARGCKLTAEEIYSINAGSLKDAIVQFNGGCTAEIIGREGLILTNHHCGYGQIQSHSRVGRNLLDDGFWAKSKAEELPNPGTVASILVRMEDVTEQVLAQVRTQGITDEAQRERSVQTAIRQIAAKAADQPGYEATIRPFFYGSVYYLFVLETFRDVRLVGAPPSGIGKFGGDTDNWMWPRHTGDFSLFRIYADHDNRPADYAEDNLPFRPRRVLQLAIGGIAPGDFTMVMGYPGRTQEYLPSYGIENITTYANPYKIDLRTRRLRVLDQHMKASEQVRIQYAAKYASVANAWKKWQGESRGLHRLGTLARKRREEDTLRTWIAIMADPARKAKYSQTLPALERAYTELNRLTLPVDYMREAILSTELLGIASRLEPIRQVLELPTGGSGVPAGSPSAAPPGSGPDPATSTALAAALEKFETGLAPFYKDFDLATDQDIAIVTMDAYLSDIPLDQIPIPIAANKNSFGAGLHDLKFAGKLYTDSRLTSEAGAHALAADIRRNGLKALRKEPAFALYRHFLKQYQDKLLPDYQRTQAEIELRLRELMDLRREAAPARRFYPDANSTLRVAYGKVGGYKPVDGVAYEPFCTLDGVIEKRDTTIEEFAAPRRLVELWQKKDFGPYADARTGKLPLAFIASNHTTGGNSGSPVLDAQGRLIGTNFDRCWEGTMSDLEYDPQMCRNIAVDVRYTLFIIDKFAGAGYLLGEMDLVKN